MSSLENRKISETYKDLLQISNSNIGVDGDIRFIQDGEGSATGVGVSTSSVHLSAAAGGDITLEGPVTLTGSIIPSMNSQFDLGSAEYKIRHLYLSSNSLYIGDSHRVDQLKKITVTDSGNLDLPADTTVGEQLPWTSDKLHTSETLTANDGTVGKQDPLPISTDTLTTELIAVKPTVDVDGAFELANQFTLANGEYVGQLKNIIGLTLTDSKVTITPVSMVDGNKIVFPGGVGSSFEDQSCAVSMVYTSNGWLIMSKSSSEIIIEQ